ncbi:hypothetical protein F4805DRAFT_434106 [Annulohypoxylon moriforme]|nr:hypothetical protein F4805DRAFT_434106 [Annulohypoxylon moriforme]
MNNFPGTQQHTRTFLNLPLEIRVRIYEAGGLVVGANLRLAPSRTRDFTISPDFQPSDESLRFTYSILQTCKVINAEVITHICSRNKLFVFPPDIDYGLGFLRRLNPQQCSALTDLSIELYSQKPIPNRAEIYDTCLWPITPRLPTPALLTSWQVTARHILSHVTPQTLSLQLFCDTGISDTTFAVLQPLKEFPGILKDCELQLYHQPRNTQVRALAWETYARAKGLDPDLREHPFRFFDLPAEIRRHVLEYTDLVAPYKEVYWCASRGFHISRALSNCADDDCDAHLHQGRRFLCCAPPHTETTGYVCCQRRSGYSSRCQCWVPPTALLLTNHSLYREAVQVLYSCNRVIVVPSGGLRSYLRLDGKATRLDASRFLTRHRWPDVLHHLRSLEFVFPAINPASSRVSSELVYHDLCFAIDHLKAHADVPKLTIIVNVTSTAVIIKGDRNSFYRTLVELGRDKILVFQAFVQLLDCLKTLRCMRRFFVHVEWAGHWSTEHPRVGFSKHDELDLQINEMESWLEKMVMGDQYNSEAEGKMNEQPSIWLYGIWATLQHIWWTGLPRTALSTV